MLPASNKGVGMNMGFPDVCLTPAVPSPIPIPYPNMGMHAMATPFCATILLSMVPALNMGSIIPMTMGDEAGVANPLFKQMGMFTTGNPKVILQGMPAITVSCPTSGNNMNNPVGMVAVPAVTNVLYTHAAPAPRPSSGATSSGDAPLVGWERGPEGAGRLIIRAFTFAVPALVHTAVTRLGRAGMTRLFVDLRGNPGGELSAAVEILADLLPEGAVIATAIDGDGDALTFWARGDAYRYPMVIRVDRGTASAAEIFAGSLQAHGRALVVGERTYGKGVARAVVGGQLLDVARLRLPDGREIDGHGITPDVEG